MAESTQNKTEDWGFWKRFFGHLRTINHHRRLVRKGCFRIGLYKQGLMHDLSKYSPSEFWVGVKYYQGHRSPNNAEREDIGYSSAWLHHQGRNKHHYEYWRDYQVTPNGPAMVPVPMPRRYVAEMCMDRIAACKTYQGSAYTDESPIKYYRNGAGKGNLLHPDTAAQLEMLLTMLAEKGEEETFRYIRHTFLHP
ncbi:MAG: DUF5662 family protein [Lachnospiraceae bacterium]|nr:DUF5662 family protein [Lachnospiraceae bacterium]